MYDYYVIIQAHFNCFICFIIYWIQTLENTNKTVKSERDLIKDASEVDTASFWYVSEKKVVYLIKLFIVSYVIPSLGVEKMDISENLL